MKNIEKQNIIIGKKIKEYRECNGYTQEEVAHELKISSKHYGRIERGENSCTISNLITLCNLFAISSESILGSLTYTKPSDELSHDLQSLTLDDKLSVSNYIDFLIFLHNK